MGRFTERVKSEQALRRLNCRGLLVSMNGKVKPVLFTSPCGNYFSSKMQTVQEWSDIANRSLSMEFYHIEKKVGLLSRIVNWIKR